jgi:hypothetical protein
MVSLTMLCSSFSALTLISVVLISIWYILAALPSAQRQNTANEHNRLGLYHEKGRLGKANTEAGGGIFHGSGRVTAHAYAWLAAISGAPVGADIGKIPFRAQNDSFGEEN